MPTRTFALTYPQLMNQALAQGMDGPSLRRLRSAYELAEVWFNGFYRGQGIPFICHVVRTAAIVLAERQPVAVVMAAMLHAAYMKGRFNEGGLQRPLSKQRAEIAQAVGSDVEGWIWDYHQLPWFSEEALCQHLERFDAYDERQRRLLVMRLANELEDHLDTAMAYRRDNPFREKIRAHGPYYIEFAHRLGRTQLAEELKRTFASYGSCQVPQEIARDHDNAYRLRCGNGNAKIFFERLALAMAKVHGVLWR